MDSLDRVTALYVLSKRHPRSRMTEFSCSAQPLFTLGWEILSQPVCRASVTLAHRTLIILKRKRAVLLLPITCRNKITGFSNPIKAGWESRFVGSIDKHLT